MAKITVLANERTSPRWAGQFFDDDSLVPGGAQVDPVTFPAEDAVRVNVGAAGAAGNATSVPVDALTGPIPSGTTLHFGSKKFATLTAPAAAGDTAITVEALPTALVQNDNATYPGLEENSIPSGTLVSRTYAQRNAGTPFHKAVDGEDEYYLTAFDVSDASIVNDVELYRHNGLVMENYLPAFASLSGAQQAKIRALYECTVGVN